MLADMRTGSNFLEASLNEIPGVRCHGELFNPLFVGHLGKTEMFGVTHAQRSADPARLLARMRSESKGLPGFRYFRDHDPRVLDLVLADPGCAKIVLTRNPLDSFVSLQIAAATDQWLLRDPSRRRTARIRFDGAAFRAYLDDLAAHRNRIAHALQIAGQTAFQIGYDDLGDVAVLNGLAAWLGTDGRLTVPSESLVRQNPEPVADKVTNPAEMEAALAGLDPFGLWSHNGTEPRRGPMIPSWVAAAGAPVLFLPIRGGPVARIETWLAALDGVQPAALKRDFNQKTLRHWRRLNPDHRSFTVVRHPVARAHAVFCATILPSSSDQSAARLRETLRLHHAVPIPEGDPGKGWTRRDHRAAFLGFLAFVKANLAGQTGLRTDPSWASQEVLLQGFASAQPPDHILREERLGQSLPALAAEQGIAAPDVPPPEADAPFALGDFHDVDVEAATRTTYGRDYAALGYDTWQP